MEILGVLFLCIVFGIATAAIASAKNRPGCGWAVLGCLLGPIALLTVGFMPKLPDPTEKTRKCPFCAEDIKPEAVVCKHCGRDVPPEEDEEEPLSGIVKLKRKIWDLE